MAIADPLSRLARQEDRVENLDLPVLLAAASGITTIRKDGGKNSSQRREGHVRGYAHRPTMAHPCEPYQQHHRGQLGKSRLPNSCSLCRQAIIEGSGIHTKGHTFRNTHSNAASKRNRQNQQDGDRSRDPSQKTADETDCVQLTGASVVHQPSRMPRGGRTTLSFLHLTKRQPRADHSVAENFQRLVS